MAVLTFIGIGRAPAASLTLPSHVPAAVKQLQPTGRLNASTHVHLAIGLPLRDPAGLQQLLQDLYNPASPNYRHYLTPQQLTEKFGPTAEDYQAVVAWAKSHNLNTIAEHPNRLVLEVDAPVGAIEAAMHVNLRTYQHPTEARTFFAPDADPTLDIPVPVITVSGLSDFYVPHPHSKIRPVTAGVVNPKAGSGPSGSYGGNDFRAAYAQGVSLTGTGQSVALVEFDGYYAVDIASYESQFGLPSVTLSNVAINGGVSTPGSGNSEVALDIEMAVAMAPGLSKVYVYEAPNSLANFDPMLSRMQTDNLAKQIGCSWGGGPEDSTAENIFQLMAAQGQSFFNATGDGDAFVGAIPFPSDSPNITQVGATTLTTGSGAIYSSETAWNWGRVHGSYTGTSGGISTFFSIPVWQQGISMTANQGSTTLRNVPDVALTGDNIYVRYNNGTSGNFGGTSCAAPLWAAVTALINQRAANLGQPPVGFINPAVYAIGKGASYTSCFNDTTAGNNFSSSSPTKFSAVTGFDLCTGWGTPSINNLMNTLVVSQGVATKLTMQTQPSSTATAGVSFAVQPVIRIEDGSGNLQTNDNSTVVTAARLAGAGTLQGTTSRTASGGLVTFTNLSHRYATNITITFTSGSLTSATSSPIAVSPAAFSQVQILVPGQTSTPTVSPGRTGTPTSHVSGAAFNVTVNAVDAFWNFVNTGSDNVALASSDGIAVLPASTSLISGTAILPVTLKSVGSRTLTASDVSDPGNTNDVSPPISVTPATLTVVASDASRVYGQANPLFGGTLTGVQPGDNITATFTSTATTNSAKGSYAIVPALIDPNSRLGNYTVLSTNGTLTITPAPMVVTGSNATRQYGQTNPVFNGTITGLQNNDNITAAFSTTAAANSTVENYPITPTLSDPTSKLSNYVLTTNNGVLTVTTAPLTISGNDSFRVWGEPNPTFTGSIFGLKNSDNITANYSTTATTNSPVGSYPITITLNDPGVKLPNYTVTTNNGSLAIANSAPYFSPAIQTQFAAVGSTVSLTAPAHDPDAPYQTLTFSLEPGAPSGANIDSNTGAFTWTPPSGSEGTTNSVTIRVADNAVPSQSATAAFNIIVIDRPKLVVMYHNNDGSVSMQWSTTPGVIYHLQFKNALSDVSWSDLNQFTANDSLSTVSDTPSQARFYQLSSGFAASDPAGVMPLSLPGASDSYISLPFSRPITDSRPIASIASNVVTLNGGTWTADQFVYSSGTQSNYYYARFDSGTLEGRAYNIVSNDANTLTLDLGADTLDNASTGDLVSIIPHWSLASAFPNGDGIITSPSPGNRFTEILYADNTSSGFNLSSSKVYFFNAGIWKQVGQGSVNHGDDVLARNSYFVVRQNVATNSTMTALGAVVLPKLVVGLRVDPSTLQDNALALTRATEVTLDNSGLISSGAFLPSPLPGSRTDELLTFDNTAVAKNKSASAVFYYWNNAWRQVGLGSTDVGSLPVFTPGSGFVIRKATNATSGIWTNAP